MYTLYKFYPKEYNSQQYWDNKYAQEHIAGKSSEEFRKQDFWPLLQKYLDKSKHYLDAGCGVGGWIIFLAEDGYNVEGIDTMARTVRALTEYDPSLTVKVASITRMPYKDASLDGVIAIGTLECVENAIDVALDEVKRVLAPQGLFFFEVPSVSFWRRWFYLPLKTLEKLIKERLGKKPTFSSYLFTRNDVKKLLADHDLEMVEMHSHELPGPKEHYGLYIDFPFLRGQEPYELNVLGRLIKLLSNAVSPWIASTGMVVVAKKR